MKKRQPSALGLALLYLRSLRGLTQRKLSGLVKLSVNALGRHEKGDTLSREKLEEMLPHLGASSEAVDVLVFAHNLITTPTPAGMASPVALTPEECRRIDRTVIETTLSAAGAFRAALLRTRKEEKAAAAHREAEALWASMQGFTMQERRDLVTVFPEYRLWTLALRVCQASVRAASHKPADALELARLALFIAERVPGHDGFRACLRALVLGFVANARRVLEDYEGADADFARARQLCHSGTDPDGLLPAWRLDDLEASLRRAQRRFSEALDLLDRAYRAAPPGELAGRILLNKSALLEQMTDFEGSLETLEQAARTVETSKETRLLFALYFNTAANLRHLERYEVAAALLPKVRELAVAMASDLDLVKLVWLEALVAAGQGRYAEATASLERVQSDFTSRQLPYDAALSSLDLASLWLSQGQTARARALAKGMAWIFTAKGIDREALAALKLFCEAAGRDAASAELARQVRADIEAVRQSAQNRRPEAGGLVP